MKINERVALLLEEMAHDLYEAHTVDGDWQGDDEAKDAYHKTRALSWGLLHSVHLVIAAPVEPDSDGFWIHPGLPDHFDEDPRPFEQWLSDQLLECSAQEVGNDEGDLATDWADSKPTGTGWFLLQLIDTEDGPTAFWVRRQGAWVQHDVLTTLYADAERYRWIREKDNFPADEGDGPSLWDQLCELECDEFDQFIDQLRAAQDDHK